MTRLARWAKGYAEALVVLAVAVLGLALPGPGRWLADRHAVDLALAALVLITALAIPAGSAAALSRHGGRLLVAVGTTAVVLPVLAWLASRMVADEVLRRGVLALGVAPAEVASVAAVGVAEGDAAVASTVLIASTLLTVVLAGPVLALIGGGSGRGGLDVGSVLANLAVVIALPLVVGLALRNRLPRWPARQRVEEAGPVVLVALLVGLVASEVVLSRAYVGVVGALVVFVAGSSALGSVLGHGAEGPVARSVLLTTAMRDFAVAAGIATAAFGVRAAGPLGVYGLLVIVWGLALAGYLRRGDPTVAEAA